MAEIMYVTVASGQSTSGAFAMDRPHLPVVIAVPSLAAGGEVRPQFSATSGGPFSTLQRLDGSGQPYAVHSGIGPAIGAVAHVPTPWARLFLTTSAAGDARTFTLFSTR